MTSAAVRLISLCAASQAGCFEVLRHPAIPPLGGDDFDNLIADWIYERRGIQSAGAFRSTVKY